MDNYGLNKKEKRILKYISAMPVGSKFTSADVAKALNLFTHETGKKIAILSAEKQISVFMYGTSSKGDYQYMVVSKDANICQPGSVVV